MSRRKKRNGGENRGNGSRKQNHTSVHDRQIQHNLAVWQDIREEIKQRITQRDQLFLHMIVSIGATLAFGLSNTQFSSVLVVTPFITILYSLQIMMSYHIHDLLAGYLRNVLEPNLANLCQLNLDDQFSIYFKRNAKGMVKRRLYIFIMWIINLFSVLFYLVDSKIRVHWVLVSASYAVSFGAMLWLSIRFWKESDRST